MRRGPFPIPCPLPSPAGGIDEFDRDLSAIYRSSRRPPDRIFMGPAELDDMRERIRKAKAWLDKYRKPCPRCHGRETRRIPLMAGVGPRWWRCVRLACRHVWRAQKPPKKYYVDIRRGDDDFGERGNAARPFRTIGGVMADRAFRRRDTVVIEGSERYGEAFLNR